MSFTIPITVMLAISLINSFLCIVLLAVYINNYRKIKVKFTLGLVIFALLLLFSCIFHLNGMLYTCVYTDTINVSLTIDSIESILRLIALSILLYVTFE